MIDWRFIERQAYGYSVGDYVPGKALQGVRKLSQNEILDRESGQNTMNQPNNEDSVVEVDINVIELTGTYKDNFLQSINYNNLQKHLTSCASAKSTFGKQLKNSLKKIDNENRLILIRIDDYNSKGLTGPEDLVEMTKDTVERNFYDLCRANFVTSENAKSSRGGSYGVGKSILWKSSMISTVLFSSYVAEDKLSKIKKGMRFFGRTELATHKIREKGTDKWFDGPGFFGSEKKLENNTTASISMWDDYDLAEKLYLNRDVSRGTGASILVVGYYDGTEEINSEPLEILERSKRNMMKFFWPSLLEGRQKIKFNFHYHRNRKIRQSLSCDLEYWQPFINSIKKKDIDKTANDKNKVARKRFNINIPASIEHNTNKTSTYAELSVYRGDESLNTHPIKNTIALTRGFGMVVDYYYPKKLPMDENYPFFGVLKLGTAIDIDKRNELAEEFFKYSEPPLHDAWIKSTESLKTRYVGYQSCIDEFYDDLDNCLFELCGEVEKSTKKGPELLSKMLNFGRRPERKPVIKSENIKAIQIEENKWKVSGTIEISKIKENKNGDNTWQVEFGFTLKEETGMGDKLPFDKIYLDSDHATIENKNALFEDKSVRVSIKNTKYFSFEGDVDASKAKNTDDLQQLGNYQSNLCSLGFYTKDVQN